MAQSKLFFGVASGLVQSICFIPYVRDVLKKKTTPHIYSWFIWTVLQAISIGSMASSGAGYGVLSVAVCTFFCFGILLLSLRFRARHISILDILCLVAALITLLLWLISRDAMRSIVLVTLIDLIAFIPTLRKGYHEPFSETISLYWFGAAANVLAILSIGHYSITTVLYPATLVFSNIFFVSVLKTRRRQSRQATGDLPP
jgi:hypothetical protein